jgi:hypothetical protein
VPSVPTVHLELPANPPADWREQILRALSSEGVTEPPYVPIRRLVLANLAKILGWVSLGFLPFFVTVSLASSIPEKVFTFLFFSSLIALPLIFVKFSLSRLRVLARRSRVEFGGRNPTHAVMTARYPPIFYLRPFSFDDVAAVIPLKYWVAPTPEMTLILRLRQYAPVLAIGKPTEGDAALGALRFHVTDARWEAVVKAIVPCCQLVIWVTGNTRGLNWEIEHLVSCLPPHRLLLWPHVNVEIANKAHIDWETTAQQRNAEWQQFVDAHIDVFPKPLPRDVGKTRFVAFDADWTPVQIPNTKYLAWARDRFTDPNGITAGLHAFLEEKFH